ncbi:MAG TPA: hypothetical protein VGB13_02660 [Candidatus Krumholzibacteria bacterium]
MLFLSMARRRPGRRRSFRTVSIQVAASVVCLLWTSGVAADYAEECLSEGCSREEIEELYESYDEECLNEGCSREELIELAGGPQHVNAMLQKFRDLGYKVADSDGGASQCRATGTIAKCRVFLLTCQDWYQCPTGSDSCEGEFGCPGGNVSSAWYVCGGCFGFDF